MGVQYAYQRSNVMKIRCFDVSTAAETRGEILNCSYIYECVDVYEGVGVYMRVCTRMRVYVFHTDT